MAENTSLTLTQERVVQVLASGKASSAIAAAELAGVNRETVARVRQNPAAQREVQRLIAERSDKARDIKALSAKQIAKRLAGEDSSDQFLLGAYKVSADVVAQGIDEEDSAVATPHEMATAYQRRLKDFRAGIQYAQRMQRRAAHQ